MTVQIIAKPKRKRKRSHAGRAAQLIRNGTRTAEAWDSGRADDALYNASRGFVRNVGGDEFAVGEESATEIFEFADGSILLWNNEQSGDGMGAKVALGGLKRAALEILEAGEPPAKPRSEESDLWAAYERGEMSMPAMKRRIAEINRERADAADARIEARRAERETPAPAPAPTPKPKRGPSLAATHKAAVVEAWRLDAKHCDGGDYGCDCYWSGSHSLDAMYNAITAAGAGWFDASGEERYMLASYPDGSACWLDIYGGSKTFRRRDEREMARRITNAGRDFYEFEMPYEWSRLRSEAAEALSDGDMAKAAALMDKVDKIAAGDAPLPAVDADIDEPPDEPPAMVGELPADLDADIAADELKARIERRREEDTARRKADGTLAHIRRGYGEPAICGDDWTSGALFVSSDSVNRRFFANCFVCLALDAGLELGAELADANAK